MAVIQDFRDLPYARPKIDACGTYLGHKTYWKLYAIENYVRVILHTVLSAQIGKSWLDSAISQDKKKNIERFKKDYSTNLNKKVHALPGNHDVYYLYLSDLSKIMQSTRHLIVKIIADVDSWVVKLEGVRLPRNLIGHMNFPHQNDRDKIDTLHKELTGLVKKLEENPSLKMKIP